jgi:thiamine-monophosphate kinase
MKSVVQANKVGNDYVAQSFYETWAGREQYRAIGKFLANLPFYSVTPVESQPLRPRILDAGCGPGNYVKAFDDLGLETVGIDISTEMLAIASQVTSRSSALPGASPLGSPPLIMEMDALSPEFPDNFFDGIWYSAIFVHIPKIQAPRTLAKLHSILKDEGVLYLSTQTGEGSVVRWEGRMFFYYTEDELKKLFWDAGFQAVEEWGDITIGGTQSDTKKKLWRHYLLKKRPFQTEPVLANLGERELLNEIRKRFPTVEKDPLILGVGDDCAALSLKPGEIMVVTTDPCPTPVINLLENRQDYWHEGWFSMIINLSDLASMGATPLGFLMAVEAEEGMPLKKLERFFTGVRQAADTFQCPVIGGNVKDGPRFHCVGTALGAVQAERILRRDAAESGELMVVLGDMGHFWAGVIHYLENIPLRSIEREFLMGNLKRPLPRVKEGMALVQNGLSRCAMDSSDGLVACFYEIARTSQGVDVHLDFSQVQPHPLVLRVAGKAKIDVRKLMLAWGDWQLVCTVRKEKLSILKKIMKGLECPVSVVGHLEPGTGQVWYHDGKGTGRLSFVASERFTPHSYFSHGLASYLKIMRQTPLYTPK